MPWPLAMIIVVVVSSVVGLANSCLVNIFGLQPFIATLAMSQVCEGVAYLICSGKSVPVNDVVFNEIGTTRVLGIPLPGHYHGYSVHLIFGLVLSKTVFGRSVYMIGGNPEAARLAGLNPKKISTILYVIAAMIAAFAGVMMTTRMHSGQPAGAAPGPNLTRSRRPSWAALPSAAAREIWPDVLSVF